MSFGDFAFSILERIVVGETAFVIQIFRVLLAFSILERIVVGETMRPVAKPGRPVLFQYPRTDRCG